MLPFSLQCGTCGEYIYRGTKFNAMKEEAGEYLGIPVWRFYFRCSNCSAEMAMKTDPKNADYVCELGWLFMLLHILELLAKTTLFRLQRRRRRRRRRRLRRRRRRGRRRARSVGGAEADVR